MKKIFYFFYFCLPFVIWFFIYLQRPDLIVIFKRPINEESLIISIKDLWQIILVFTVVQFGNEILWRFLSNYKIFGKIQIVFIFFHLFIAFYILIFNFF